MSGSSAPNGSFTRAGLHAVLLVMLVLKLRFPDYLLQNHLALSRLPECLKMLMPESQPISTDSIDKTLGVRHFKLVTQEILLHTWV